MGSVSPENVGETGGSTPARYMPKISRGHPHGRLAGSRRFHIDPATENSVDRPLG
jgi:hypothetical protein